MTTRTLRRFGYLALMGLWFCAGTAAGAEPGDGPGRPMPPAYNPQTGGAPHPAPETGGEYPYRKYGKSPSGGVDRGTGNTAPGSSQKENASGDPLKGLNVHKAKNSEDKTPKCHDAGTSFYAKC